MRPTWSSLFTSFSLLVTLDGCAPTHPVTEGVCESPCLDSLDHARVLVWTNEPTIYPLLVQWVEQQGGAVIDTAIVEEAVRGYHIRVETTSGQETLQQLARRVGADRVLWTTVDRHSYPLYNYYSGYKEGNPRETTLFDPKVTVRSFGVTETRTQWTVTAIGASTSFVYEPAVTELVQVALQRASCDAKPDMHWTDEKGCMSKY